VAAAAPLAATFDEAEAGGELSEGLARWLYPTLGVLAIVAAWELIVRLFNVPIYIIPAPSAIVATIISQYAILLQNSVATLGEILAGFALSVAIGVPLAIAIAYSRFMERVLYPILVSSQTVPKIAVAPLFIVWFGFGTLPKVIVAFLIAFFPIVIDSVVGLRSTEPEMIYLVRSMGANGWQTFTKIRLPKALPSIFGGFKIAIALAVVGAIVGEFVGADTGLGYLLMVANGNVNTRLLFATITVLTLIGVVLFFIVEVAERLLMPWAGSRGLEGVQGTF
jgi:NitT/TauT family transport system permease protein